MSTTDSLTDDQFWDATYARRLSAPLKDRDFKNQVFLQIAKKIERLNLDGKSICEVGGGDAQMLSYLARKHPDSDFSVIDYSERGCALAGARALRENVSIGIFKRDFFKPSSDLINRFDVVISHGVVEHFNQLPAVLETMKLFLKKNGLMFTVIPNFSSPIYSFLCKRWSEKVFALHVTHGLLSLAWGHRAAGFEIMESGYIGSVEFGMLSMARNEMPRTMLADRAIYMALIALSMGIHWMEVRLGDIPPTRMFSPFIYVVAKKT